MWKFKKVSAYNFKSFIDVEYSFESKCYVVIAENKDNQGQSSNGGGKSSFIDIPAILLLGYSLTGRNLKDCVNWATDEDSFTVYGELENKANGLKLEITRKIYSKTKSGELVILVNGVVPKTLPTKQGVLNAVDVKAGNKYLLEELLDINETDLLNYFFVSRVYYKPFLEINTDSKLEVISRFTNTSQVDKAINKIKKEVVAIEEDINQNAIVINQLEGSIITLKDFKSEDALAQFELDKNNNIKRLEVEALKKVDFIEEREGIIENFKLDLEKKEKQIKNIDAIVRDGFLQNKLQIEGHYEKNEKELRVHTNKKIEIENFLAGLITCPECKHKFNLKSKAVYTGDNLKEVIKQIDDAITFKKECEEIFAGIAAEIKVEDDKLLFNSNLKLEIKSIKATIFQYEKVMPYERKSLELLMKEIEDLELKTFEDKTKDIEDKIQEHESTIMQLQASIEDLKVKISDKNKWIDEFFEFKFYLGNKPLSIICSLVNKYLEMSGSDLNLQIEGFKKLKSGELRQALNPIIYRNWMNPREYGSFSDGEKTRLNLAVDKAFQQLINSPSKYGGLDFYSNDELCNPLDSTGIKNIAEAFNKLDRTILLVSHSGADLNYTNSIVIQKEGNISKVV